MAKVLTMCEEEINIHFWLEDIECIYLYVDAHVFPMALKIHNFSWTSSTCGCQLWPWRAHFLAYKSRWI
jgi:hypothetical protein